MTRPRSRPRSSSEVRSETTFRKSISRRRVRAVRSSSCNVSSVSAHWVVMPSSSARSVCVNSPSTLFSISAAPIVTPFAFFTGAHRIDAVVKPVSRSTSWLKRGSA